MPRGIKRAESRARYFIREQAIKKGWNINHVAKGGDTLEENEIVDQFPDIGLGLDKPDFLFCIQGEPSMIVEAKNEAGKSAEAIKDATDYADSINKNYKYRVRLAVGVAGTKESGYIIEVRYLVGKNWQKLTYRGYEITNLPSIEEARLAISADDGSTTVSVPSTAEFIDAAIEISRLLRLAKVEAPLRPKVIGSLVLALYEGDVDINPRRAVASINNLVKEAINASNLKPSVKVELRDALKLSGADFNRLSPFVGRIVALLRHLNIHAVVHSDADFLGMFYEAFLRYGYDNTALGIVFTPRHITRFCVNLLNVVPNDRVIDIACGTGGFLVGSFDKMMREAHSTDQIAKIKNSLYGFDTNPTIWALAMLNMFFRGDGKSNIVRGSCFDPAHKVAVRRKFTKALLNPPFSQEGEPERDFIDAAMEALEPGGLLAVVVKAGIFADDEHKSWREQFCRKHTVLGVISLPEDLFYPTAVPTSILLARAHIPLGDADKIFMARVWNDGYQKLKNRRVEATGSQIQEVLEGFKRFIQNKNSTTSLAITINGSDIKNGQEFSPQEWLPQPVFDAGTIHQLEKTVLLSIFQSTASLLELTDVVLDDFGSLWLQRPPLLTSKKDAISCFFDVKNGKSKGEKNYKEGEYPYVSSGDVSNSIIRLVEKDDNEIFKYGGITVTAFGQAFIQPWPFMARGNGGSSVRVLIPRFDMSFNELLWFAAQINSHRWRFHYGRMAIKSRLVRLQIESPPKRIPDRGASISRRVREFKDSLIKASEM